jgi:tetratricopeptide (TPR) repeat protein
MTIPIPAGLRHLAFFEALGELETSSSEWASTSAGLVALRLFDLRRAQEGGGAPVTAPEIGAVRDAISAMPADDLARAVLQNVVEAATEGEQASTERALPALLAYGKALQLSARWPLGVDVFETILAHPASGEQGDLALQAALTCAYCLRASSRFDEAEMAYDRVRRFGTIFGDRSAGFLSQIGRANVALQRGNYPRAELMLDAVIADTGEAGLEGAHARALHDRGAVAYRRGQLEEALGYMHRALVRQTEPSQQDRLLADIAHIVGELGHLTETRDVHLVIEATAIEQDARWMASINLMDLAALDRSELLFERRRRHLAEAVLPPHLRTLFLLDAAKGHRRFGRAETARGELGDAIALATRHGLNDLVFQAESLLAELGRESSAPAQGRPSTVVDDVLRTGRGMRQLSGAPV